MQCLFKKKKPLITGAIEISCPKSGKIIEHLIAVKIDNEVIPINPSDIQKQILDAIEN